MRGVELGIHSNHLKNNIYIHNIHISTPLILMNSNLKSISRSVANSFKSVESRASSLATDKNVLYIMLVMAVVNVVGYLMMGNFEAVLFFAIVAYLSTFFTKNMVIVFLISILATNFLMGSKVNYFSRRTSN